MAPEFAPLPAAPADGPITLHCGYLPGAVGRITELHASYYSAQAGFGQYFESMVATGLARFAGQLDQPDPPGKALWLALQAGRIVGSVAIDVEEGEVKEGDQRDGTQPVGHLRWFILAPQLQGRGVGRQLLDAATRHGDQLGLASCYLWTFRGLDTARHLYESFGFRLVLEQQAAQWGKPVAEQKFVRARPIAQITSK